MYPHVPETAKHAIDVQLDLYFERRSSPGSRESTCVMDKTLSAREQGVIVMSVLQEVLRNLNDPSI